jgi:AcrR family transcriptional regulator
MYSSAVPKLWDESIKEHRRAVNDAILDTTASQVARHGLRGVTMSQIAADVGIGRATLYKYFPDVEAILLAWHERHVAGHLHQLGELRDGIGAPDERLRALIERYALIRREQDETRLGALLHGADHVGQAQDHLRRLLADLIREGASIGQFRDDVSADELAMFCLAALTAAGDLPSQAAVRRLVSVTMSGLRPPSAA